MDFDFQSWEETRELPGLERALWAGGAGEMPQRRGTRRRRRKKRRLRSAAVTLLAAVVMLALLALGYRLAGAGFFTRGDNTLPGTLVPGEAAAAEKVLPVLLLGVDHRPGDVGRADTIIVAFLDLKDKEVRLLSVPRDTFVYLPGRGGGDKINASYAYGGPEEAMQAVGELLGIDIAYYIETDFRGFEDIIDTLGGVTVNVDQRMYHPAEGINLYKGVQKLNGRDALAYVRYRDYPMGDIDRIKHQQAFLSALADQALQLRNIWKIPTLVKELRESVETNLSTARLVELGNIFRGIDSSRVESYLLPGDPQYIKGISYMIPRDEEIKSLVAALKSGTSPQAEGQGDTAAAEGSSGTGTKTGQ